MPDWRDGWSPIDIHTWLSLIEWIQTVRQRAYSIVRQSSLRTGTRASSHLAYTCDKSHPVPALESPGYPTAEVRVKNSLHPINTFIHDSQFSSFRAICYQSGQIFNSSKHYQVNVLFFSFFFEEIKIRKSWIAVVGGFEWKTVISSGQIFYSWSYQCCSTASYHNVFFFMPIWNVSFHLSSKF